MFSVVPASGQRNDRVVSGPEMLHSQALFASILSSRTSRAVNRCTIFNSLIMRGNLGFVAPGSLDVGVGFIQERTTDKPSNRPKIPNSTRPAGQAFGFPSSVGQASGRAASDLADGIVWPHSSTEIRPVCMSNPTRPRSLAYSRYQSVRVSAQRTAWRILESSPAARAGTRSPHRQKEIYLRS